MGKQYISTATALDAHDLDIVGLAIAAKYTITVSSDGNACFWDNKLGEAIDPNTSVITHFISSSGVHGIAVYENMLTDPRVKVVLMAFTCFDGSLVVKYFVNDDIATLKDAHIDDSYKQRYWAPAFYKHPSSKNDYFICTKTKGSTDVFDLVFAQGKFEGDLMVTFQKYGVLELNNTADFPYSVATSASENEMAAIGYSNGDVSLYNLSTLKPVYTFDSTDLQFARTGTNSTPRALAFSPSGELLAVARDNQSSGSISLYDVTYGENVGVLTSPSHSTKSTVGGFAHDGFIMGLSFNETGKFLASCGFDMCVRVWDIETRQREATLNLSTTDFETVSEVQDSDKSIASGVSFIKQGIRSGYGADTNDGLCVISFDRGVRWFREAGGI